MAGDREYPRFLRNYWGCHWGWCPPRTSWHWHSLKALRGYAPSALQTDILPRSSIGDRHSPCHAMMSSEVRAASICKNRAISRSPAMRDLVYEVESPWVMHYVPPFNVLNSAAVSWWFGAIFGHIFALWDCHDLWSHHGSLFEQKFAQKLCETAKNRPRFCSSLNEFYIAVLIC